MRPSVLSSAFSGIRISRCYLARLESREGQRCRGAEERRRWFGAQRLPQKFRLGGRGAWGQGGRGDSPLNHLFSGKLCLRLLRRLRHPRQHPACHRLLLLPPSHLSSGKMRQRPAPRRNGRRLITPTFRGRACKPSANCTGRKRPKPRPRQLLRPKVHHPPRPPPPLNQMIRPCRGCSNGKPKRKPAARWRRKGHGGCCGVVRWWK